MKAKNNTCDEFKMIDNIVNTEKVGMCITDFDSDKILFVNSKMALYAGESDIIGMIGESCRANKNSGRKNLCPFCSYCSHENLLDRNGQPAEPNIREEYVKSLDIWLKIVNQAVERANGRLIRVVTFYDITEAQKMREQLTDFMFKDRLLGLKNDASMEKDIQEAAVKPSLLLFEVSSMRKINEFYGWQIGDYLLVTIRDAILSKNVPKSELYRIGGDKFCLTIGDIRRTELKKLAEEMSELFTGAWTFEYDGTTMKSFNEVSIAVIHKCYIQGDESLLSMSERMLARAKEKKKIVIYSKKMDRSHMDRLQMEWDLKRCVHENMRGFDVFYQPIVDSGRGMWCGLEALCRWNSPDLGPIPPSVFIPEAERLELIETLGLWVLKTAVGKCKSWKLDHCDSFVLNVNLSAAQFRDEELAKKIIKILKKYDFPGEKLCIEITESTNVTFLDHALHTIEEMREYKILVALDDFGTGYSSFSRLKSMPVDIVKIERMFVSDIERDEYHRYLFHAMTGLAHAANMKLIAEGVERKKQMDILVKDGADYLQGYLFGKPLPPDALEKKLMHFQMQTPSLIRGSYAAKTDDIGDEAI